MKPEGEARLRAEAAPTMSGEYQIRQITRRNRGHKVDVVIDELNRYVRGWLNYFKLSSTYSEAKDLAEWVRRRMRLYYWKPA